MKTVHDYLTFSKPREVVWKPQIKPSSYYSFSSSPISKSSSMSFLSNSPSPGSSSPSTPSPLSHSLSSSLSSSVGSSPPSESSSLAGSWPLIRAESESALTSSHPSTSNSISNNSDTEYETYVVGKNETLVGVALKCNMGVEELRKLNKIFHSSLLISGQKLKVRKKAPATHVEIAPKSQIMMLKELHSSNHGNSMPELPTHHIPVSRIIRELMIPHTAVDVFSAEAEYIVDGTTVPVHGMLTMTPTRIIYEPDLDDPQVLRNGVVPYTFSIDTYKLTECYEVPAKTQMELVLEVIWKGRKHSGTAFFVLSKKKCNILYRKMLELIPEVKENAIMQRLNLDRAEDKKKNQKSKKNEKNIKNEKNVKNEKNEKNEKSPKKGQQKDEQKKVIPVVSESNEEEYDDTVQPVLLEKSLLFTNEDFEKLRKKLPGYNKYANWELIFSTQKHGISFNSFQNKTKGRYPSLVFVEDSNGHVFGGFATDTWAVRPGYFGTGQSFLFTIKPNFGVFEWTRANNFFMCMDKGYFCMGGGKKGGHGFWVDSNFEYGGSTTCDTFLNRCLASAEEFTCTVVEVWGFSA